MYSFWTPPNCHDILCLTQEDVAEIIWVVTNPDRSVVMTWRSSVSGRKNGRKKKYPPLATRRSKNELTATLFVGSLPISVSSSYGKILPQSTPRIPRMGFLNVHFSSAKYRWAAPIPLCACRTILVSLSCRWVSGMDEAIYSAETWRIPLGYYWHALFTHWSTSWPLLIDALIWLQWHSKTSNLKITTKQPTVMRKKDGEHNHHGP